MKEKAWGIFVLICLSLLLGRDLGKELFHRSQEISQNKLMGTTEEEKWNRIEGVHCVVYYKENLEEANMTLHMADSYFPLIAKDFSWQRKEKIDFVLYHQEEEMRKTLHLEKGNRLPMGAYYKGVAAVLSPSLWADSEESWKQTEAFIESGPVVHEMVHFAIDEKAKGQYPHWLSEGVALYYEKKYTGFEWRRDLREQGQKISMEDLYNQFETLEPSVAYRKSYDWVNGFVHRYGEKELQNLLKEGKMCLQE